MSEAPSIGSRRPVLITGGAGFIGSNIANRLAQAGHDVVVFDALLRPGVEANLEWLQRRHPHRISVRIADIRDAAAVAEVVADAQAVFHMAAQVAVTNSLIDPKEDFDVNLRGTFNLLDAVRRHDTAIPIVFASTNKVYGDLADIALESDGECYFPIDRPVRDAGIGESRALDFHTPYGCSKGAADQYVLDFARSFGMRATVLRMSCIYGQRQMGTEDQGWVAHFLLRALRRQPIKVFGDGCQVRDVLEVDDAVTAYLAAWENIDTVSGRAFNLGGGPANAVSLRQVLAEIASLVGHNVDTRYADWRPGDQRYYVSDTRLIRSALRLPTATPWRVGLASLATWLRHADAPVVAWAD